MATPERCPIDINGRHCWHYASFQHAMVNHRDEYCCWCSADRCLRFRHVRDPMHGPHAPPILVPE